MTTGPADVPQDLDPTASGPTASDEAPLPAADSGDRDEDWAGVGDAIPTDGGQVPIPDGPDEDTLRP